MTVSTDDVRSAWFALTQDVEGFDRWLYAERERVWNMMAKIERDSERERIMNLLNSKHNPYTYQHDSISQDTCASCISIKAIKESEQKPTLRHAEQIKLEVIPEKPDSSN